ncbi:MAG TPA: glucose 1-dehydrogenase [Opitutaceae bacterium]|nr:glucose 1-dehydrogenase [Opitutaceae bacterium]
MAASSSSLRPLHGRRALVTGASSGIGEAIAVRLAAAGATVVNVYRSHAAAAKKTVAGIRAGGGEAIALRADMAKERDITALFAQVHKKIGPLDILVNSAGMENEHSFLTLPVKDWDQVMNVNLRAVFLCSQLAARTMIRRKRGVIINISSVHAVLPWVGYAHYCASKGGLEMLMKTMALELAPKGIRVNNVAPGAIATPINESWLHDAAKVRQELKKIPLHRIGRPEEVAGAVLYLASDEAAFVTGTTLYIDGGRTL